MKFINTLEFMLKLGPLVLIIIIQPVIGTVITHQIKPGGDFTEASHLGACSTLYTMNNSINCNPAFATNREEGILHVGFISKGDGDSIENGKKLILEPINEKLLRSLFENDSFNSFSLSSNLTFHTNYFTLEYSPYYLVGDILLFNPAFASMSLNLINRETLRAVTAKNYQINSMGIKEIKIGLGVASYTNITSQSTVNLIDLASKQPEDLVPFEKNKGISSELGALIQSDKSFLPDLSLVAKNIGAPKISQSHAQSSEKITSFLLLEPYSTLGIGKTFVSNQGLWHAELLVPFRDFYQAYYAEYITTSIGYQLGLMDLTLASSKYISQFGMNFKSRLFDVGIIFAKERDLGAYSSTYKDSVYISAVMNL